MTGAPVTGSLLGLLGGVGLILAASRVALLRRPRLEDRLGPYVRDGIRAPGLTGELRATPFPAFARIFRPLLHDLALTVDRWFGGSASVQRRLVQAGSGLTLVQFRVEQVLWGAAGVALPLLALAAKVLAGVGPSPVSSLSLAVLLGVGAALARDTWLTRQVTVRDREMATQLPVVAELLALAVTAGEGPVGALERVCRSTRGELSAELSGALAEARAGASLIEALVGLSRATSLASLARFVSGMATAIERGTPLADVLRAQAADAREAAKRSLLAAGGRKEIAMLVPVVFLVLPTIVVFALYPGFVAFTVLSH